MTIYFFEREPQEQRFSSHFDYKYTTLFVKMQIFQSKFCANVEKIIPNRPEQGTPHKKNLEVEKKAR